MPKKNRGKGDQRSEVLELSEEIEVHAGRSTQAPLREATDFIVLHCSATKRDQDIGRDEIDGWHKERGWKGCGYHKIIRRDGTVEDGRGIDEVGAHAYGYNLRSVGVCIVGGLDDAGGACNNFGSAQLVALGSVLDDLLEAYPEAQVVGHRDLSPDIDGDGVIEPFEWTKECPAFSAEEMVAGITKS